MENRIPKETLLKGLELIQGTGVDEKRIFKVSKHFDPEAGEKILQAYIQKGKVENLDLSGNLNVESLPKGLKVKNLHLNENKSLKHLPKIQAERIWAMDTNIEKIEEGLKCEYLNLNRNEMLKHLPKIEVKKIRAIRTNIESIADGLKCEHLDLERNTSLKAFPKNLEVGKLDLRNTYFSETHTEEEVRKKIKAKGGKVDEILI